MLIKCNLAVIVAERGIKLSDIADYTGISRNTMSSLANNKGNGIQYDTLEKICKYLNITPGELLTIIDFNVEYKSHEKLNDNFYELLVNFKLNDESFDCMMLIKTEVGVGRVGEPSIKTEIQMHKNFYSKLSILPKHMLVDELEDIIAYSIFNGRYEGIMFETETTIAVKH